MSGSLIDVRADGYVRVVTLDDSSRRNALSKQMSEELSEVLHELDDDADVRAVVLTGKGDVFSSGADMSDETTHAITEYRQYNEGRGRMVYDVMEAARFPVIGAINGPAVGAGAGLAISCDLRIASRDAWIQFAQVRVGVIPANGNTLRLARLVGVADTTDIVLTGRKVRMEEAERLRLVNRVVEPDAVLDSAMELAQTIARQPPLAVQLGKETIQRDLNLTLTDAARADRHPMFFLFQSEDRKEATAAWLERREPKFIGR